MLPETEHVEKRIRQIASRKNPNMIDVLSLLDMEKIASSELQDENEVRYARRLLKEHKKDFAAILNETGASVSAFKRRLAADAKRLEGVKRRSGWCGTPMLRMNRERVEEAWKNVTGKKAPAMFKTRRVRYLEGYAKNESVKRTKPKSFWKSVWTSTRL